MRFMRYHAFRVEQFVKAAARECDRAGRRLIDIGSHNSPYRKHFTKVEYFLKMSARAPTTPSITFAIFRKARATSLRRVSIMRFAPKYWNI